MNRAALIVPGGQWQLDLIRKVRELGLRSIVADISPTAPARAAADRFEVLDTNDLEGLTALGQSEKVAVVLADQTDRLVPVAAEVSRRLGLPGTDPEVARRFSNKLLMREGLLDSDVPMPRFREVRTSQQALGFAKESGFPVVLKPKDAQSSIGVFRVTSARELIDRFPDSLATSKDGALLVEEFIDGTEVTVEGLSAAGECHVLAISQKEHYADNPCVARKLTYPPDTLADSVVERLRRTAKRVVELLGQEEGLNHAEYRVRGGIPYLIEVAARGGGNAIASRIVPHISGIDTYGVWVRNLLGERVTMPVPRTRSAILEFFSFPAGKVRRVEGVNEALGEGPGLEIVLPFAAGEEVVPRTDDRNRPGYFIVYAENLGDSIRRAERVRRLVRVQYD